MTVNATAVWRVRPGGSNTNGGGYDSGIAGAATDYSQRDTPIANGTNGATTGTTNFADTTANAFTAAMKGNAIYITGTGQTTGFYFVTAVVDAANVTLDRSPGTGTGATWNLGGGWADFWTNCSQSAPTPLVKGNTVYILGSGTPNPASYTYDYTAATTQKVMFNSATFDQMVTFANDPATPGYKADPDTTGGMPTVSLSYVTTPTFEGGNQTRWKGIWFVSTGAVQTQGHFHTFQNGVWSGCVFDMLGKKSILCHTVPTTYYGCEFFSSVGPSGSPPVGYALFYNSPCKYNNCNFHDLNIGCFYGDNAYALNCIFSKNNGPALYLGGGGSGVLINCTIDGNTSDGILIQSTSALSQVVIYNCIISNHVTAATFGLNMSVSTTAYNESVRRFIDYNVFYNNSSDINNLNYGPHDTHGGSNPYVGQATENYTLA